MFSDSLTDQQKADAALAGVRDTEAYFIGVVANWSAMATRNRLQSLTATISALPIDQQNALITAAGDIATLPPDQQQALIQQAAAAAQAATGVKP